MANLRLTQPNQGYFGVVIWLVTGAVLFGVLYMMSAPRGAALRELQAAGPDGVTAFFASPESAVREINALHTEHAWARLARYYDFTGSTVAKEYRTSGAYFAGGLPASAEDGAPERPFPPGWRFLYAEPSPAEGVVRVVVAPPGEERPSDLLAAPPPGEERPSDLLAAPPPGEASPEKSKSFLMRRFPEGYRIVPEDAAERLPSGPSVP